MEGVWSTIAGTILSGLICKFLLNILNNRIGVIFNPIQEDLGKLTNKTRNILNFLGVFLSISITVLLYLRFEINHFEAGLVLGALQSVKDMCFKNNKIENDIEVI